MAFLGFGSKRAQFWDWFVKNSDRIALAQPSDEVFAQLGSRLRRVNSNLVFELTAPGAPERVFVISADGNKSAFADVEELVDCAPQNTGWRIVRFRPPEPNYADFAISMGERTISAADVKYELLEGWTKARDEFSIAVRMYIRGCEADSDPEFVGLVMLFLDTALGEYDVEMKLGGIKLLAWSKIPENASEWKYFTKDFHAAFDRCTAMAAQAADR